MAAAPPPNYRAVAQQDAARYGLGPWFVNQIQQESGFDPNARSGAGAEGIAQFIPSTAKAVGLSNPYDPIAALDAAARFDKQLVGRYGSVERALSAYNSGNPDAYLNPAFAGGQTYRYVRDILGGATPTPVQPQRASSAPARSLAAAATTAAPPQPQVDYRPRLASELAAAASSQGNNLQQFYGTLAAALRQRENAAQQPAAVPNAPGASPLPQPRRVAAAPPVNGLVAGNTQGENTQFLQDLARLAQYEGHPVSINSGYRSYAKQAALYANRASNPNPVAAPGHSLHEQGLAADGTVNGIPLGTLPAAILARFGLATVAGDPVHVQLAGR